MTSRPVVALGREQRYSRGCLARVDQADYLIGLGNNHERHYGRVPRDTDSQKKYFVTKA